MCEEASEQIIVQKTGYKRTHICLSLQYLLDFASKTKHCVCGLSEEFFKSCTGENVISTAKLVNSPFS